MTNMEATEIKVGKYSVMLFPDQPVCASIRYDGLTNLIDAQLQSINSRLLQSPSDIEARIELAKLEQDHGHLDNALREFEIARNLDPENIKVLMHLAVLYASEESRKYEESETCLREVLQLDPNFEDAQDLLSDVKTRRDSWI